jgi:hypothetical protein
VVLWLFWIGLVGVPFAAGIAFPHALRHVVAVGGILAGIEWVLVYSLGSEIGDGGDWQPGSELLAFTGILALIPFAHWFSLSSERTSGEDREIGAELPATHRLDSRDAGDRRGRLSILGAIRG